MLAVHRQREPVLEGGFCSEGASEGPGQLGILSKDAEETGLHLEDDCASLWP